MTRIKAVIFDYIGTLVNCKGYTMDASIENLFSALVAEGFDISKEKFQSAYAMAHEKYRIIRYEQLREVTNAVWVAEALSNTGIEVTKDDCRIKSALNVFFKTYIDTFELREGTKKLLKKAQSECKVGLISNFTYAPVIYSSLRLMGINTFFNTIAVSEENGWRKPSNHIFQYALSNLQIKADEAIFIGDSPIEDIQGAKHAGLKTVFVCSQFSTLNDLSKSEQEPDCTAKDLLSIIENFTKIMTVKKT